LALALCGLASSAQAGGLYLNEFGTPSMGVAGAGAQAVANDASTSFHNPAGMTRLQESQLMGGIGVLKANTEFDRDPNTPISGNDGGKAGGFGPILGSFGALRVTDDLRLGLNVISISGAVLDYNNDWAGRFQSQEIEFLTLSIQPTLAYRINDYVSVGAGALILYANLNAKTAVPPPNCTGRVKIKDADDFDAGFIGGGLVFGPSGRTPEYGTPRWSKAGG
jgi:long-chain fatty acid transport protein